MKKRIAIMMATILALSIAAISALPLDVESGICAATDGNLYKEEGTGTPHMAPLNPDFVAYLENPPEEFYGYIPPPMNLSHLDTIPVKRSLTSSLLPNRFDWRDYGKVTPVKSQGPCETCWTFGTATVLESAVLINESAEYNFSEQSVALCVDRSWIYMYDALTDPCMAGGWSWLASEVLIRSGSVLESCNPYNVLALNCNGACVCDSCPPVKKVEGYRLATDNGSQIGVIKDAVYTHGPVTMAFYYDPGGEYSVEHWGTIYDHYPCFGRSNHIVSIIGWNDTVPHPNPYHTGTGAWIVKNSWGMDWGNDGFFYLAYDSSGVEEIAYLEYKDPVPGEELFYWDEAGRVSAIGYWVNSAWMASVFITNNSGDLTHVDFWTTSNNAQYEIYVWNGYFGVELARQTGNCQELGYYSVPLSTPISIDAGQQFTVGVKMTTPGYGYPIPVEYEILRWVKPPIQKDVSFVRYNSSYPWMDLADDGYNACLRVRILSEVSEPFDTEQSENPYPSIFGTHNGTITPNQTIKVSKMYTYTGTGTGGHSEYVAFYNLTTGAEIANGTWNGYQGSGDYHYIDFEKPFMLEEEVTYNYSIRTGSYPQIHHTSALLTANGWINCTKFTDANGIEYTNWIPAIRLE